MNEEIERRIDEQERLPEHLQRWFVFDRPDRIRVAKLLMHLGFFKTGQKLCGMRYENDDERTERLRKYWEQHG